MGVDLRMMEEEQKKLGERVILKDAVTKPKTIGGIDQAYYGKDSVLSCIVVCAYPSLTLIEKQYGHAKALIPYISGLLAYREMPAALDALQKLKNRPDILFVDANGILHPRRCGMASHLGIAANIPTIGVSKSLILGNVDKGKIYVDKELRGIEIRTKEHANPLYVSPGHLVSFGTAVRLVQETIRPPHKLPEPLQLAHRLADKEAKSRKDGL